MKRLFVILTAMMIFAGAGCASQSGSKQTNMNVNNNSAVPLQSDVQTRANVPPLPGVLEAKEITGKQVTIRTEKGDVVFELLPAEAPLAVSNFVWLARHQFYNGLTFHRVVPGFVVQGGDPEGDGRGGPGYAFADEPVKLDYKEGIVAMANSGPNTNGSQFFIMLADTQLEKKYTIFGRVVSGMDTVKKIAIGDQMKEVVVEDAKK